MKVKGLGLLKVFTKGYVEGFVKNAAIYTAVLYAIAIPACLIIGYKKDID